MTDIPKQIWDYLAKKKGLGSVTTAAFMGNMAIESRYDPTAENEIGAYGLCQWLDRRSNLEQFTSQKGKPISDLETQLEFILYEISGSENGAYSQMLQYTTVEEQTVACCDYYERPGKGEHKHDQRIAAALEAFQKQGEGITIDNTYDASSSFYGGSKPLSSDSGFKYIEHGKSVTIIKLPENKTFCEPIYPDLITVSDTVPQWIIDVAVQNQNAKIEEANKKTDTK
jgi:hypothetical protein